MLVHLMTIMKVSLTSLNRSMLIYGKCYITIIQKPSSDRKKSIMNDLITSLNLSKRCKVIRVIDTRLSIFMDKEEIRKSIRMLFEDRVSYDNIKKGLRQLFWKDVYDFMVFTCIR